MRLSAIITAAFLLLFTIVSGAQASDIDCDDPHWEDAPFCRGDSEQVIVVPAPTAHDCETVDADGSFLESGDSIDAGYATYHVFVADGFATVTAVASKDVKVEYADGWFPHGDSRWWFTVDLPDCPEPEPSPEPTAEPTPTDDATTPPTASETPEVQSDPHPAPSSEAPAPPQDDPSSSDTPGEIVTPPPFDGTTPDDELANTGLPVPALLTSALALLGGGAIMLRRS